MKILIVTAMFPPNRTGTSFYSRNLANALSDLGHEISIITTRNSQENDDSLLKYEVSRIPALHFPIKNYFKHLRFCSLIPSNFLTISKKVTEFRPTAIILINHYLDIAFPAIYAAKKSKIPLYISVGTQLQSLNPLRNKILSFFDRLIVGNLVFPFAKRIISWDREIERYISETHSKKNTLKSVIIPFGVNGDIKHFNKFNNEYKSNNQILGVGAIIDHRDYVYQIRVFKVLLNKYPDLKLKIIGNKYIDKPIKVANELGISDKVIFTGELSHDDVLDEYKKSMIHWMMLVGRYVGLGTSTLEAMLMGIPSVSNAPENLFGFDALKDMENYIYTDANSIEKDAEKLSKLIEDDKLRKKIGQNGKEFIQRNMSWENVAKQYIKLLMNNE